MRRKWRVWWIPLLSVFPAFSNSCLTPIKKEEKISWHQQNITLFLLAVSAHFGLKILRKLTRVGPLSCFPWESLRKLTHVSFLSKAFYSQTSPYIHYKNKLKRRKAKERAICTLMEGNDKDEYFRRPGSIPFKWEIQPGIPKPHQLTSEKKPPPKLSPPPSYVSTRSPLPRQAPPVSQGCFPVQPLKRSKDASSVSQHRSVSARYASALSLSFSKSRAKEEVEMMAQWLF